MDNPVLALIGDLYQQIVALQQQNAQLAAQLQQAQDACNEARAAK